jgi:hypothetical protein
MPEINVTDAFVSSAAGTLLSLLASYFPGFREKFASWEPARKQLCMLLAIVVVTGVIALLSWTVQWPIKDMTSGGASRLIVIFIETVVANQAVYGLTPQTKTVRDLKLKAKGLSPRP